MRLSDLVEHVSKKPIPSHKRSFIIEIMADDIETDEDVEVCYDTPMLRSRALLTADLCQLQVPYCLIKLSK